MKNQRETEQEDMTIPCTQHRMRKGGDGKGENQHDKESAETLVLIQRHSQLESRLWTSTGRWISALVALVSDALRST